MVLPILREPEAQLVLWQPVLLFISLDRVNPGSTLDSLHFLLHLLPLPLLPFLTAQSLSSLQKLTDRIPWPFGQMSQRNSSSIPGSPPPFSTAGPVGLLSDSCWHSLIPDVHPGLARGCMRPGGVGQVDPTVNQAGSSSDAFGRSGWYSPMTWSFQKYHVSMDSDTWIHSGEPLVWRMTKNTLCSSWRLCDLVILCQ